MRDDIKSFLSAVKKPGRYTGGEPGSVFKNKNEVKLRWAFCFPDTYEIGMSNLGMRILTGVLNELDDVWCERVYAPWTDMEDEMRARGIPLFTHESGDAINEFDIVAFTMQYELCYTNVLNMLDLGGIPVRNADRSETDPIVVAGGPCSYNPEPVAEFIDIFSIGEGEEALPELARLYIKMKENGTYTRESFLYATATELKGFYVPSLYDVGYNDDGTLAFIKPNKPGVPEKVTKRVVEDINDMYVPTKPVLPYIETVHDRVTLEVFRGCIRGCRFCQAGFATRPVREKSPDLLCRLAKESIDNSGYDEISLCSLSISDYSRIGELTDRLVTWTDEERINLALPSLRADSFTKELMDKVSSVRTTTLTFAPEAGSQRLRDIINKNVTEEDILKAARVAFEAGKSQVKLYFMDGLPGETYEDIEGIATLAKHVVDEYYRTPNRNKRQKVQVTLSVACFIPKPQTPFQWERQNTAEELQEKQAFLSSKITDRAIRYNYHDADVSRIEAVFARGDRRLGKALLEALSRRVRFDSWEEYFDYEGWLSIFDKCGIDPAFYANRTMDDDEVLPWDVIDCGVTKSFLLNERHKAQNAATTPSCKEKCSGCGANGLVPAKYCRWCPGHDEPESDYVISSGSRGEHAKRDETPVGMYHLIFTKLDSAIYIGHLDLVRTMMRIIVRSGIPIQYSEGFNPIPRITFASPLSVGVGGEREIAELKVTKETSAAAIFEAIAPYMDNGLRLVEVREATDRLKDIRWAENEITFVSDGILPETGAAINEMFESSVIVPKKTKNGETTIDLAEYIKSISARVTSDGNLIVTALTDASNDHYLNPEYIAAAVKTHLGLTADGGYHTVIRKRLLLDDGLTECR